MPNISVIIPAHNCGRYLKDAIQSVLKQSYSDFELIVINDGSTDDTERVIEPYLDDRRFRYIKKVKNEGVSAACNEGVANAKGAFVAFLHADDLFLENKLRKQIGLFETKENCGVSYTNEIYTNDDTRREVLSTRYRFSGDIFYYLKRSNFIHVSTVMIRRELLDGCKFDERLRSHEDWELFLRLAFKGILFGYIKEPLSKIRMRKDNLTADNNGMADSRREVGMIAKKYWSDLKASMRLSTIEGQRAIFRYAKLKTKAFLIGFPKRACFNKPVPQETL